MRRLARITTTRTCVIARRTPRHHYNTAPPSAPPDAQAAAQNRSQEKAEAAGQVGPARPGRTGETPSPSAGARRAPETVAERDEALRRAMEGVSGGGGAAGVEYEDGRAEGLRRGVKANMFRVI